MKSFEARLHHSSTQRHKSRARKARHLGLFSYLSFAAVTIGAPENPNAVLISQAKLKTRRAKLINRAALRAVILIWPPPPTSLSLSRSSPLVTLRCARSHRVLANAINAQIR
jgi:hypothetical protein